MRRTASLNNRLRFLIGCHALGDAGGNRLGANVFLVLHNQFMRRIAIHIYYPQKSATRNSSPAKFIELIIADRIHSAY